MTDSRPMDQKKSVPLEKLLQAVALGNTDPEVLSSVAARLARLEKDLPAADQARIAKAAGGLTLKDLARGIVNALAPRPAAASRPPPPRRPRSSRFSNPKLRELILTLKQQNDQVIDNVTQDAAARSRLLRSRPRARAQDRRHLRAVHRAAQGRDHGAADPLQPPDQGAAQVRRPEGTGRHAARPAAPDRAKPSSGRPTPRWTRAKVKGASTRRILTDLVSLVRYAMHQENELVPYPERVAANFKAWMAQQQTAGKAFTDEQRWWLEKMAEHIASNLGIEVDDFELRAVQPARRTGQGASALRRGAAEGD